MNYINTGERLSGSSVLTRIRLLTNQRMHALYITRITCHCVMRKQICSTVTTIVCSLLYVCSYNPLLRLQANFIMGARVYFCTSFLLSDSVLPLHVAVICNEVHNLYACLYICT